MMLDKTIRIIDALVNTVMIVFFALMVLIGAYAFFDSYQIYDTSLLNDEIIALRPQANQQFDLQAMQKINPDIEGWIRIFETSIDYPVVHSSNNTDYLNKGYDGNYSTGGSIFVDYRNSPSFEDDYTIMYGHNMVTGQMFSDIKRYEDLNYFNSHLNGALYTTDQMYKLEVTSITKVNAFQDNIYNLITYAKGKNQELFDMIKKRALFKSTATSTDKFVLLSTCDSYGSNDRTVLLASLTPSDETTIDNLAVEARANDGSDKYPNNGSNSVFINDLRVLLIVVIILIVIVVIARIIYRWYRKRRL